MLQFLKDSIRELKHVVWPTRKETQKFFMLTLLILVLFGTYLFIASNIFSTIVFGLKDMLGTNSGTSNVSSSLTDEEIDALFSGESQIEINTAEEITGETGTGEFIEIEENSEESTLSGELTE